jgi:hypothetical protein
VGSVCRVKWFHLGGKRFADDEEVETEMRKWLRQQSKDFCAAGWDMCLNVGGGYVENSFSRFEYHMFYVLCPFVTHLLTFLRAFFPIYRYKYLPCSNQIYVAQERDVYP